jgi:hypothetical protein
MPLYDARGVGKNIAKNTCFVKVLSGEFLALVFREKIGEFVFDGAG